MLNALHIFVCLETVICLSRNLSYRMIKCPLLFIVIAENIMYILDGQS